MRIVTTETMREIDRIAIQEIGIPGMELMHHAGEGAAQIIRNILGEMEGKRVAVLAGPGNNAGDGWVVARLLTAEGFAVKVYSAVDPHTLKGNARTSFDEAAAAGVDFDVAENGEIDLSDADIVVDALLGTGAKGAPRGAIGEMVARASARGLPTIALDNPTGVDADTGAVPGAAIRALATATFGLPKIGQLLYPAKDYIGELFTIDIGIPEKAVVDAGNEVDWRIDTEEEIAELLPARRGDGHKGTFGKTAIVAGSAGMSGAAAMAAESALRCGTGLAEMVVPSGLTDTVEALFREAVTRPVQQVAKHRCLSVRALGDIRRLLSEVDSAALGPGIGTHRETIDLVARLLPRLSCPTVIDADGLNCISKLRARNIPIKFGDTTIITPHLGELSRLLNISIEEIADNRLKSMKQWASNIGVDVLVLKGAPTTIAGPNTPVYINKTGNNGMATGGSGDVLTGIIAGFLAQGMAALDAARLGVYVHGFAGDLAASALGPRGMIAGDIVDSIPEALEHIEEHRP